MSENQQNTSVFHDFSKEKSPSFLTLKSFFVILIVIILAIGTGYFLSRRNTTSVPTQTQGQSSSASSVSKGTVIGSNDTNTFKDSAEGVLQSGGINGEGQYHLVRPGGDSQNVYLTSSIVDLSQLIGKRLLVHGQTQKAKYAGWLMDVGSVEVE